MARCTDCNKFVSYDEPQVEVNSIEMDEATVRGEVCITLVCADCGSEMKSASIDFENDHADAEGIQKHLDGNDCELSVEETDSSPFDRSEGKGRRPRMFYGATVGYTITCSCDDEFSLDGEATVDQQASSFDEV